MIIERRNGEVCLYTKEEYANLCIQRQIEDGRVKLENNRIRFLLTYLVLALGCTNAVVVTVVLCYPAKSTWILQPPRKVFQKDPASYRVELPPPCPKCHKLHTPARVCL